MSFYQSYYHNFLDIPHAIRTNLRGLGKGKLGREKEVF